MRARKLRSVAVLLAWLTMALPLWADSAAHPICALVLHQERVDRQEQALELELAESHFTAAESIFDLVDQLWQNDAIERMVYLTAKHERDVALIEVKRQRLLLRRQEAEVQQYNSACSTRSEETVAQRRQRRDQARRDYLQADCHRIGKDLAIAEVDLAYQTEVLTMVRDLRQHSVATRQDVIRAERDLEMARMRVERHKPRVQACIDSGAARGEGSWER